VFKKCASIRSKASLTVVAGVSLPIRFGFEVPSHSTSDTKKVSVRSHVADPKR
jgi:hypothetical protein